MAIEPRCSNFVFKSNLASIITARRATKESIIGTINVRSDINPVAQIVTVRSFMAFSVSGAFVYSSSVPSSFGSKKYSICFGVLLWGNSLRRARRSWASAKISLILRNVRDCQTRLFICKGTLFFRTKQP